MPTLVLGTLSVLAVASCGEEAQPGLGAEVTVPTTIATTTTTVATTTTVSTVDFNRPVTQGTATLGEDIGPTDVAALVADIRGQTADVSAQVGRLAPFLDLPLVPVAQITGLDLTMAPEDDDRYPVEVTVRFRTPEPAPDLVIAIENQLSGLAWFPNEQVTTDGPDGPVTRSEFRYPGFNPDETEFLSMVVGDPAATTAELTYRVLAEEDEVADEEGVTSVERLSSWQAGLELTRVATLTEVGIETDEDSGRVLARYSITADDEAEAIERLLLAVSNSDYELLGGNAEEAPTTGPLRLVDESGAIILIDVSPTADEDSFAVEASHGFELTPLE
ncbi:MAG: hypothetical protein AAFO29_09015 [Actinomycetota bacterium]